MKIGGWLNLEMNTKQRARAGRFYLDGAEGRELSPAVTITEGGFGDGTVRIEVYRYVLGEARLGGTFFMPRREDIEVAKRAADALLEVFAEDDGNECWFVWKLYPNGEQKEWDTWFNCAVSMVVIARSEDAARELAAPNFGAEGREVWQDEKKTCCERIGRSEIRETRLMALETMIPGGTKNTEYWFLWRFVAKWGARVVVAAKTEAEARDYLAGQAGGAWADPLQASSERLGRSDLQALAIVCGAW